MIRKVLFLITLAAFCLTAQKPANALDKAALEAYLRHLFVWPAPIVLTINDPKPGPMAGYYEVLTRGVNGSQMQEETLYVSFDGKKIVRGQVFDITENPFKKDIDKIKTDLQPSFGTPGAPVVIAEFSDYECPYCREEAKVLRDNILKTYPKEVHVYYFDFPLEQIHPWAKPAAMAGRCIFRQNPSAYWEFHDWVFENQKDITLDSFRAKLTAFLKGKDVNATELNSCIDSKATEADVIKTLTMGQSLGINSTPTIFVNGRRLPGTMPWNDLKFIIDYEIGYQKIAKNAGEDCGCSVALPTPGLAPSKPNTLLK